MAEDDLPYYETMIQAVENKEEFSVIDFYSPTPSRSTRTYHERNLKRRHVVDRVTTKES
jgi:hypothetical protein